MERYLVAALAMLVATPAGAQSVSGCGTAAIAKAEASDRVKLGANADCFGVAKILAASAEAMRRDRIARFPPMPVFVPTPSVSPTRAGLPSVASGINVADYLWKSGGTGAIPPPEAGPPGVQVEGAFRFLCAPSHIAYDDPVVYPGQPGKSHLHQFFGNTLTDANSTYASLRTTGESSCSNLLNRSAYWISAMLNGHGKVVQPDWLQVYYKRQSTTDPICTRHAKGCLPLPRGLRYVFGYNMQNPAKSAPAGSYYWNCLKPDGTGAGHFDTLAAVVAVCAAPGSRVGAVVSAPPCWNGKDLDSPDHRSHMAWQAQDGFGHAVCPDSHPYILPQFTLGAWYSVDATLADWYLSSDRMRGMADQVAGTTLHSDWFGAWEDSVQAAWTANCIEKMLSCSGGDLGDGTQMATTAGYDMPQGRPLLDVPARP